LPWLELGWYWTESDTINLRFTSLFAWYMAR